VWLRQARAKRSAQLESRGVGQTRASQWLPGRTADAENNGKWILAEKGAAMSRRLCLSLLLLLLCARAGPTRAPSPSAAFSIHYRARAELGAPSPRQCFEIPAKTDGIE
jgi:hypothetical protein